MSAYRYPALRVRQHCVTITEQDDGWLLCWSELARRTRDGGGHHCEMHATAAEARQAVRQFDESVSTDAGITVTTITWEPRTRVGRMVVVALSTS